MSTTITPTMITSEADIDLAASDRYESYYALLWTRFRKSTPASIGGLMILCLLVLAIFAEFFAPTDPNEIVFRDSFIPPQRLQFVDAEGTFHLVPYTYNQQFTIDPETSRTVWAKDTSQRYHLRLFVRSWEYRILGIFPSRLHLFDVEEGGTLYLMGTGRYGRDLWGRACMAGRISLSLSIFAVLVSVSIGAIVGVISGYYRGRIDWALQRLIEFLVSFPPLPLWMALAAVIPPQMDSLSIFMVMVVIFAMLGWTMTAREVRGKVLSYGETDFVLAAKEMGASDARIIFRHLFPNSLSHIIVVLTLTIPQIILAEAFLSFLGIGIQEPLVSWGFLMKNAQNLETLGSNLWILSPTVFIVFAVLGFNFLGDGLRDAADPYSIV
ncbi:MAG: ABC transporter permease [Spirochaetota bacterium]